jgi:hypothetical protein
VGILPYRKHRESVNWKISRIELPSQAPLSKKNFMLPMKLTLLLCVMALAIACSNSNSNTFQSLIVEADSDTAVIHQKFVEAFEAIDTAMTVVSHSFVATEVLSIKKDGAVECVPGYMIEISEMRPGDESQLDIADVVVENNTFAYFLPNGSQSPFLFKDPINLATDEFYAQGADYRIENYSVPGGCKVIAVRMQSGSHAGNSEIAVTLYSWSTTETSFIKLNRFKTFVQFVDDSLGIQTSAGNISFIPSYDGRVEISQTVHENEKETTNVFKWGGENFIQVSSSAGWDNSYESITFNADSDTASIHRNFVKAFTGLDSTFQLQKHSLKSVHVLAIDNPNGGQECLAGYLMEIATVDPNYEGNDSGWYEYAYFLPTGGKGPFTVKSSLDLYDSDGSTATMNKLVDYEIGNECHVIAVDVSSSNDLGWSNGHVDLYAWSVKGNKFKEIKSFETSFKQGYTQDTIREEPRSAKVSFLPSTDGPYYDLQYAEGENDKNLALFKWDGTAFVKKN